MYLRVNLLGPGPRFMKKRIYRAAVLHRLRKHCSTNTSHGNTVFAASGCELSSSTISKRRDVRVWLHPSETPNQIEMNSQFHPPPPRLRAAPSMEQSPGRVSQVVVPTLTELSPLTKKIPYQLLYSVPDRHMSHLTLTSTKPTLILSPTHLYQDSLNSAYRYDALWLYLSYVFLASYQHYSSNTIHVVLFVSVCQSVRDKSHWSYFH